ncbi:hypothetical protein H072_1651 [Dactylellina haptotyla CBS 200.50]|uniref:ATP-dependent RNA helicase n=1 Tax=Dactylellina haptotyla (strain CBS 200.50) TaxID=1284197 RepID=S8AN61_DACHA|nr:hypothetical protein H072_1651 [Dactylellina haptotyla CBS 200.50]
MLRLNSRLLGKQATSPTTTYICQRCSLQAARWTPSPSNPLRKPGCSRDYHATVALLERWGQVSRVAARKQSQEDDTEPYEPRRPYGNTRRRYKKAEDEYPDEDTNVEFNGARYNQYEARNADHGGGGGGRRGHYQSSPDLKAIMANTRDGDFSRQLHKLKREELERRDPAQVILSTMEKARSFQDSSIRPILKKALAKAYPNVTVMSQTQRNMLALLQEGYSLCATGPPASGKSFLIAVYLLQMMRSVRIVTMPDGSTRKTPTTTGIIFVPTIDLLHQYMELFETLLAGFTEPGQPSPPKETIFQGFTRLGNRDSELENAQLRTLAKYPSPHIIITTPTRFLDILNDPHAKSHVDLQNLKMIFADEVDAMVTQRPASKALMDMTTQKRIRNEIRWAKPTPFETCVDFMIERREMIASAAGEVADPVQFCCISPNLSPVLKSKMIYQKRWVGNRGNDSKANSLLNLGIQDFFKMFDDEKISPIVTLPPRIKHYALSVDITTGMMRDIPEYAQDALLRSRDEKKEIEKFIGILRSHHDPRVEAMSKEALAAEAMQEDILKNEEGKLSNYRYGADAPAGIEVKDIVTDLANDFRHTSIPPQISVEILETLLKRDNYPDRALLYVTPVCSRQQYIDALAEAGIHAEYLRMDTFKAEGIQIGHPDRSPTKPDGKPRTKADVRLWISSAAGSRGLDTPNFTHAYIMVPTTGYQRYAQMAGRIARYPFPKELPGMPEPRGQVTTIFLEEPVSNNEYAPMVDGVIQIDSPVEGLAWRRIHRMYGLCGAKVDKYFGPDEPLGVMLTSVENHNARFPKMDEDIPWEEGVDLNSAPPKPAPEPIEEGYEFLPFEEGPSTTVETSEPVLSVIEPGETSQKSAEQPSEVEDSFESITLSKDEDSIIESEETILEGSATSESSVVASESSVEALEEESAEELSPEEKVIEDDTKEDEKDYQQIELQDGDHFAPEDSPDLESPPELTENINPSENFTFTPEMLKGLGDTPLEAAEGLSEEEVKEFQAAQDDIFAAFLELNSLQEKIRQANEEKEGLRTSEESVSNEDYEVGEVADREIDGVSVRTVPGSKKPEDSN